VDFRFSLSSFLPIGLRLPLMRFCWYRKLMARYWRWRSGWRGCCRGFKGAGKSWMDEKSQCEDCPMKAWDLNYEDAVEFANGILADAAKHKEYRPSRPLERLANLAKAFIGVRK